MSTPTRLDCATIEGPSRMDLMMALFNRKRPDPVKFVGTDNGRRIEIKVWVKGLIKTGENGWKVVGTLTADSPFNPTPGLFPSLKVVCFYNDHTREGSLTDDGLEEIE